ncbi:NUDIX domain-containing protein [Candidatus Saccharibacteria bacterium]|nr:NUDIX domain-containing protein [Candidatus Saccharibacteria bacterium]
MNDVSKKETRFRTMAGVLVVLIRQGKRGVECLLQKRQNTGFADGLWDFSASGHVEENEPMTVAVCRESKEEVGVTVLPEDARFIGLYHILGIDNEPRLLGCFVVDKFSGEPSIGDSDEVSELAWFSVNSLPDTIIDSRKRALEHFLRGDVFFEEFGWGDGKI